MVLLHPNGRLEWKPKGKPVVKPDTGKKSITSHQRDGILAISPSGKTDFTPLLKPLLKPLGVIDAVALDEKRAAAILSRDKRTVLAMGRPPEDPDSEWEREIDLHQVNPPAIEWPRGLIWSVSAEVPFGKGKGFPDRGNASTTLGANRWGLAVVSSQTGNLAVVRPGDEKVEFSVRVPTQDEASIFAEPTKSGMLVTLVVEGRNAAVLHVGSDGKIIGHHEALGSPPALLAGNGVLVYDDEKGQVQYLDQKLKPKTRLKLPFHPCEGAASADGKVFAFADDSTLLAGKVTKAGKISVWDTFDYVSHMQTLRRARQVEEAKLRYDPRRGHGAPLVGFPVGWKPAPWQAKAGKAFVLELRVRSTGGPGKGLIVGLSGKALGAVDFSRVEVGRRGAKFEKLPAGAGLRAEVLGVKLSKGVVMPLDPAPRTDPHKGLAQQMLEETHITLRLHGKARTTSNELLAVLVEALSSDKPPMKWMRPFLISG